MISKRIHVKGARVLVLGLTFKENCPDLRNSKVVDIVRELQKYGAKVDVYDPWVDARGSAARVRHHARSGSRSAGSYDAIVMARRPRRVPSRWASGRSARSASATHVLYDIKYVFERGRSRRPALTA